MDDKTPTSIERQMYQLHKEGYQKIAQAIGDMKVTVAEAEIKICLEVNGAVVKDVTLTEDDEEENS